MYIGKTTASERIIIQNAVDGLILSVEQASRMLERALEDYFREAQQKPIQPSEAKDLADVLDAVDDILIKVRTEYNLTVGNEWAQGTEINYRSAERCLLVREVERLRDKLGYEATKQYADLEDEEALPILRELAKQKGVRVDG